MEAIIKPELFYNDIPYELIKPGDIAIDTETLGLNVKRDKLCLLQFSYGDGSAYLVQFNNNYDAPNLKKLLSDENRQKILHFARFDVAVIDYYLGVKMRNIFCTKIASKLSRTYTDYHGLKELCRELLSVTISKQQQSSDWASSELSLDQLNYAASDVLYLHDLRERLTGMLIREGRFELAKHAFDFLTTRATLDLEGFDKDIFEH
jgi:ribonuclease D